MVSYFFLFLFACSPLSVRSGSRYTLHYPPSDAAPTNSYGCVWVERNDYQVTINTTWNERTDAQGATTLYYCCPMSNNDASPRCRAARWSTKPTDPIPPLEELEQGQNNARKP